jgi:hypothetical protein
MNYYHDKHPKIIENDLVIYLNQVKNGQEIAKQQKLVLAGLIRNSQMNIPFIKKFYNDLKMQFLDSVFLIVENNSIDETRKGLLDWTQNDPSVIILCDREMIENQRNCQLPGFETFYTDKIPYSERIQKLSTLRNIYLEYIQKKFLNYDLMAVLDLDLHGEFFMDGILQSIHHLKNHSSISAISCNGLVKNKNKYNYYDSFAYIELGGVIEWDTSFDKSSHDYDVLNYTTKKYMKDMKLDQVLSAFGGFCIYNLSDIIKTNSSYSYSKNEKLSCEHSHFHKTLQNIYVNPRMIFLINN